MKLSLSPTGKVVPKKGKILLAEPFMDDPNFRRSVVLLCEHNEEGSFGFVLNQYLDICVADILDCSAHFDSRVSLGGPVHQNNLFYIHTLGERIPDSIHVVNDLYLGGDFDALIDLIEQGGVGPDQIRFFQGCSGWSEKQLDAEMQFKSWFVSDASTELLMDTQIDDLWTRLMETMGPKGKFISKMTHNPSLN